MVTTFGYARVSTRDQNVNRQLDALRAFPVAEENIYVDRFTGATFERPEWQRMVSNLACGDLLVVASIDRLGRSYADILDQWRHLTRDIGADITVLDMPLLDTRPARGAVPGVTGALISDIVLQLLSYVAQVEREGIRRRQAEGIAAAKARGARFGRPAKPRPPCYPDERAQFERGEVSSARAARACGVCRSTFWKWVRADRLKEALGEQDACLSFRSWRGARSVAVPFSSGEEPFGRLGGIVRRAVCHNTLVHGSHGARERTQHGRFDDYQDRSRSVFGAG